MKIKDISKIAYTFLLSLPIVFLLIFKGYLRPDYNIVLYTDNIQGEGICTTTLCSPKPFSPFFETGFYFGSELKKATLQGYHYDVKDILLNISDVSEADILGFDLQIFGITLRHYDLSELLPEGEYYNLEIGEAANGNGMHFTFTNPSEGTVIDLCPPLIPVWFWCIYFGVIVLISILFAILLKYVFEYVPVLQVPVVTIVAILIALLAGSWFCGGLPYISYTHFILNIAFVAAGAMLINALTLPYLGTILAMVFIDGWYIANYFVITIRNKPIMPADLRAVGTAAEVMGSYNLLPTWRIILGSIIVLGYAVLVYVTCRRNNEYIKRSAKANLMYRVATIVAAVLIVIISINSNTFKSLGTFAWDAVLLKNFHEEGIVLSFAKNIVGSKVREPEGYSDKLVDSYLAEYDASEVSGVQPTNIIMVMNEAFSDLRTVGLDGNIDVMPYIDSLNDNTVKGELYVSIFGGGTCNTEFEALTGNSLAFLGLGAYPYTENITKPLFSVAKYFNDNGYSTDAFHANQAQNWNRNVVYPNLGFEKFHSIVDYANDLNEVEYLHELPADVSDYKYIEKVEKDNNSHSRFLFNVTMQNHSGYERWEDVPKAASVEEYGSDLYMDTQIYLSLVKASDDACRQLVDTYKDSDEPTMIIFFGDHQPGLPTFAQQEIYTNINSYLDWYKTKFFIWTNYEIEANTEEAVSANYLPYLIFKYGNFEMPPFIQLLGEVHEKYPIISAMGVVDADGNVYNSVDELIDDELIYKYKCVQYANLFGDIDGEWFK